MRAGTLGVTYCLNAFKQKKSTSRLRSARSPARACHSLAHFLCARSWPRSQPYAASMRRMLRTARIGCSRSSPGILVFDKCL